jgi:CheY-like chemotaxis protein
MTVCCGSRTVLVVEDNREIRDVAALVLELEGYHVLQAPDGDCGLRLARQHDVDLVVLDLKLPTISGWELLDEWMADPRLASVPVIVFSAYAEADCKSQALQAGAWEYLVKPQGADRLRSAVASALSPEPSSGGGGVQQ